MRGIIVRVEEGVVIVIILGIVGWCLVFFLILVIYD